MALGDLITNVTGLFGRYTQTQSPARDVRGEVNNLFEEVEAWAKTAADAMAADVTATQYFFRAPWNMEVLSCYAIGPTGVVAHASNTATLVLNKADGAGGADTIVASRQTITANDIVAKVPWLLTSVVTAGVALLTAGQVLGIQITKQASGVVVPAIGFQIVLRRR